MPQKDASHCFKTVWCDECRISPPSSYQVSFNFLFQFSRQKWKHAPFTLLNTWTVQKKMDRSLVKLVKKMTREHILHNYDLSQCSPIQIVQLNDWQFTFEFSLSSISIASLWNKNKIITISEVSISKNRLKTQIYY